MATKIKEIGYDDLFDRASIYQIALGDFLVLNLNTNKRILFFSRLSYMKKPVIKQR
ncbi:hypothetical protein [Halobacillus halophilus]|uniref:hypothetical protein n=1 Tax=Halobacillus halophilus TaxID=1570 RepID=UPI0013146143|nr:hypothetical protein [Halobacillus halophilus]